MSLQSSGRNLIDWRQMPRFILLISPIIITFVLMFSGGHGYSVLPGSVWLFFLIIAQAILLAIKKMSKGKRSELEQMKLMDYQCGVFAGFNDDLSLVKKYSERIVFHMFTITYLAIHLFAPGIFDSSVEPLSGENQIFPSIFFGIVVLFGIADIVRMKRFCFSDMKEVIMSVFIGIATGALGLVSTLFGKNAIFFNNAVRPAANCNKICKR